MSRFTTEILRGLLAGAAGATALNMWTYGRQAISGSASGATPDQAAEATIEAVGGHVPGSPDVRQNRLEGLGPLSGYGVGLTVAVAASALHAYPPHLRSGPAAIAVGLSAMAISDGVMTALGITDPTAWTPKSLLNDALPHLAYGAVTVLALHQMSKPGSRVILSSLMAQTRGRIDVGRAQLAGGVR